ncbi:phosphomevalonate kinase [Alkalibacterium olivapovliticus]|uniref:phosphomevalonate kinase n=1 Tax=Alkalibacterium olivapovliticus TaxID=99907 RepID=A0A2T0W9S9_9LACT|nr:phosphomevalonate kinase [Alkalibacterium olivapovliticus]PRY83468.1 phosphomevalonate kinase [Alkalibacterium olivapovliticus]
MKKAHAKAPGKLYIAGEYAVVEPGHPSIIAAVDRFITVEVAPSENTFGSINSTVLSTGPIKWERKNNQILSQSSILKADIVFAAMVTAEAYLRSFIPSIPYYDITITSDMLSDKGLKYGLGSSGAVTVALIQALLDSFSVGYTPLLLYKLSAVAHLSLNSKGSFGDLAAASFSGLIAYSSFDKRSVQENLNLNPIKTVVEADWPHLSIEQLPRLNQVSLLVGWTGSPASTESLVSHVETDHDRLPYEVFLTESKKCVERLIIAIKQQKTSDIFKEITYNRQLLLKMSRFKQFELETPLLSTLCCIAETFHAAAKSSGAGGGDCGIALISEDVDRESLLLEWIEAGITPLPLTIHTH